MFQDFLHWVFVLPLIMAVSFVAILFFGRRLPKKGSEIGVAAVGVCFVLALVERAAGDDGDATLQ